CSRQSHATGQQVPIIPSIRRPVPVSTVARFTPAPAQRKG
ncbi:MAG: hypothetical protein AVDCRST_MAG33-3305, partial [uncultured Thermomicrobiales bacterium]